MTGLVITMAAGYIASLMKPDRRIEEIEAYTLAGCRKEILLHGKNNKGLLQEMPCRMDKYTCGLILFFIIQYIVLGVLR